MPKYCIPNLLTGANDGSSPANAWRTWAAMNTGMVAGDDIWVPEGTYTGEVMVLSKGGTPTARLQIRACTADCSRILTPSEILSGRAVYIDCTSSLANGMRPAASFNDVTWYGIIIKNATNDGWDFEVAGGAYYRLQWLYCGVTNISQRGINAFSTVSYSHVRGGVWQNCGSVGTSLYQNNTVEFCIVRNTNSWGVFHYYTGVTRHNIISNVTNTSSGGAIEEYGSGGVIENNTILNTDRAIYISNATHVEGNRIISCAEGIRNKPSTGNYRIIDNYFYDCPLPFNEVNSTGGIVVNNYVMNSDGMVDAANGNYMSSPTDESRNYQVMIDAINSAYITAGLPPQIPAPQDVDTIIDTATNSAGASGTVSLPTEAQVVSGVDYGPNDSLEGTYVPTYADPDDLLEGVDRGDGTLGTYHEALTGEVKSGVAFGPSSSLTGTYTVLRDTANTPRAAQVGESIVTTLSPKPYAIAQVLCGGVEAVVSGQGADSVEWVVPDGAIGDAPVVITDAQGNITYTHIRVAAGVEPTITEVSPTAGSKGDSVTITGTNFEALKGEGAVLIGGLCLTSVGWSSGRITGRLPGGLMSGLHDVTVVTNSGAIARAVDAFDVVVGATGAPLYWDMGSWDVNNWANDIPRIRVLKLPPSAKGAMVRIRIEQSANDPGFNILEMKLQGTAIKTRFT